MSSNSARPGRPRRGWTVATAGWAVVASLVLGAGGASGASKHGSGHRSAVDPAGHRTVHLRGTAYEFNSGRVLLAGATIRVAEFPRLRATVRRDGTYDLVVPNRAAVTPYIVAAGYHTIYLQTFTTDGEDLVNVNFQTPTEPVYRALAALVKVPLDAHGNPVACAIVSTFSTKNVRDLSYAAFSAYGAHGVAGATATGRPALPRPVYFNQNVIPDPAQTVSSQDGGVIWTRVPAGVYTISGHDPATRFASFVATCRPGRIVNANPPWGLHQLAPPNPAHVAAVWSVHGARVTARSLWARRLPVNSVVRVSCSGPGCPFTARTFRPSATALNLRRALSRRALTLRSGQIFEVAVSAHAFNGLVVRWTLAGGRAPSPTTLCVPLGNTLPRRVCPSAKPL